MINLDPGPADPLLLVEGPNDKHVIRHLVELHDPTLDFAIRDYEGIDGVLTRVSIHIDEATRPAVGIVVDADTVPSESWNRVCGQISNAQRSISPIPPAPDPNGTVIPENPSAGSPRVGIWIMPDNVSLGELEGFVSQMIPAGDHVWPLSQRYIDDIPVDERKFAENKTLRAQIHAWLAAREDPRQMGLAIRTRDLAITNPLSQTFLAWLSRLYA